MPAAGHTTAPSPDGPPAAQPSAAPAAALATRASCGRRAAEPVARQREAQALRGLRRAPGQHRRLAKPSGEKASGSGGRPAGRRRSMVNPHARRQRLARAHRATEARPGRRHRPRRAGPTAARQRTPRKRGPRPQADKHTAGAGHGLVVRARVRAPGRQREPRHDQRRHPHRQPTVSPRVAAKNQRLRRPCGMGGAIGPGRKRRQKRQHRRRGPGGRSPGGNLQHAWITSRRTRRKTCACRRQTVRGRPSGSDAAAAKTRARGQSSAVRAVQGTDAAPAPKDAQILGIECGSRTVFPPLSLKAPSSSFAVNPFKSFAPQRLAFLPPVHSPRPDFHRVDVVFPPRSGQSAQK